MQDRRVEVVLLTGAVGSGKTATAIALGHWLEERGLPAVVLDLDWLGWAHLGSHAITPDDMIAMNLASIWPNLTAEGMRYAVLARGITGESAIVALREAVPAAHITVVRLTAGKATLEARLRRRDVGAELAEHLRDAGAMAESMEKLQLEDFVDNTEGASVDAVAAEVVRRLGWTAPRVS